MIKTNRLTLNNLSIQSISSLQQISNISDGFPPLGGRIVGGVDAKDGQVPYQCSLQRNGSHFCGCVIISKQWILTAGHCLQSCV